MRKYGVLFLILTLIFIVLPGCSRGKPGPSPVEPVNTPEVTASNEAAPSPVESSAAPVETAPPQQTPLPAVTGPLTEPTGIAPPADRLTDEGMKYLKDADYENALKSLSKAVQMDPGDSRAFAYRGKAYFEMQDYRRASGDFEKAIDLDKGNADAYFFRGLLKEKEFDETAEKDFTRAILLKPDYAPAYYRRGVILRDRGDKEKAKKDFAKAMELDPRGDAGLMAKDALEEMGK